MRPTIAEMDRRIAAARATLGRRLVMLGHHYQRDEVIKFAKEAGVMPLGVEGQVEAEWVLVDLGDIIVTRKFSDKGSTLTVENAEGARFSSPQKMLDDLIGHRRRLPREIEEVVDLRLDGHGLKDRPKRPRVASLS